jgi:hypothetical protein
MPRAIAVLVAVSGALLATCGGQASPSVEDASSGDRTTYRSAKWGYTVSFPSEWRRARGRLSPKLTNPREILSLGTFPPRYRPTDCEAFAGSAQQDVGPRDAFLTIQESAGRSPDVFSPRPRHFGPTTKAPGQLAAIEPIEPSSCPHSDALVHWIPFRDAGREFYVLFAYGKSAPQDLRAEAYGILDSLRFDRCPGRRDRTSALARPCHERTPGSTKQQPPLISPTTCPRDTRPLPADAVAVAARTALRAERPDDRPRILSAGLADHGPRGEMVRGNCGRRVWRRTVAVAIDLRRYHPSASLSGPVSFVARTPKGYVVYALGR